MKSFIASFILLTAGCAAARAGAPPDETVPRLILWRIVAYCLDSGIPDYCGRCPSPLVGSACDTGDCRKTTSLWAQTPEYVAIRDRKMCGCPQGYVHGLIMPREWEPGIEAARDAQGRWRFPGIWQFAWDQALASGLPPSSAALVINPPNRRSQDHFHIHVVNLLDDGRRRILEHKPELVADLKDAWDAASRHAKANGLAEGHYGVAVVQGPEGKGFWIAAVEGSPEEEFTRYECR